MMRQQSLPAHIGTLGQAGVRLSRGEVRQPLVKLLVDSGASISASSSPFVTAVPISVCQLRR